MSRSDRGVFYVKRMTLFSAFSYRLTAADNRRSRKQSTGTPSRTATALQEISPQSECPFPTPPRRFLKRRFRSFRTFATPPPRAGIAACSSIYGAACPGSEKILPERLNGKPLPLSPAPERGGGTQKYALNLQNWIFSASPIEICFYYRLFKFCSPVPEREGGQGEGFDFAQLANDCYTYAFMPKRIDFLLTNALRCGNNMP